MSQDPTVPDNRKFLPVELITIDVSRGQFGPATKLPLVVRARGVTPDAVTSVARPVRVPPPAIGGAR